MKENSDLQWINEAHKKITSPVNGLTANVDHKYPGDIFYMYTANVDKVHNLKKLRTFIFIDGLYMILLLTLSCN